MTDAAAPSPVELYERHFVPAMFAKWAQVLVERAQLVPGERVLDVACGTGIVARTAMGIVGSDGRVAALDINPDMLEAGQAAAADTSIEWTLGSAQQLPHGDAEFDAVLCQHGMQFFPDRTQAAREMRRVLRPGGRAVVVVLQDMARNPVFGRLVQSLAQRLQRPPSDFAVPFALADAQALRQPFEAAGFAPVEVADASITARFADAPKFVPLAVASSAAAVPAFAGLQGADRAALLQDVASDLQPLLAPCTAGDTITFPMWGHVLTARA